MKKAVAIITARSGSKRVPNKNIKDFLGNPMMSYPIKEALKSGVFDEVMVSTDSEKYAEIAKKYGAKVPFLRSEATSNDFASTLDVIVEVLEEYKKRGEEFEYFCCIYPTAPLISAKRLTESFEMLKNSDIDTVFPMVRFSYPIQRALKINDEGLVEMIWPENGPKRSNDLMPAYHDSGSFYWMKTSAFFEKNAIWTDKTKGIVLSELEVQDIDNQDDWKMAELKYKVLNKLI